MRQRSQPSLMGERGGAAVRALPQSETRRGTARPFVRGLTRAGSQPQALLGGLGDARLVSRRQKTDLDQVAFDHAADRRQQRGHIAALHPLAAARVEHGLELLDHEGDVAAAAEHRRDHAGERHGPGVMLHVLGVDEDLERPATAILHHVVDGDVDRVVAARPFDLVGATRQTRADRAAGRCRPRRRRGPGRASQEDCVPALQPSPRAPRPSPRWGGRWCSPCSPGHRPPRRHA